MLVLTKIHVCRWGEDPLFRGAYSFLPVGASSDPFAALQQPVGAAQSLWFAGEACHGRHSGYLQGAYLSGESAGNQIAAKLLARVEHQY